MCFFLFCTHAHTRTRLSFSLLQSHFCLCGFGKKLLHPTPVEFKCNSIYYCDSIILMEELECGLIRRFLKNLRSEYLHSFSCSLIKIHFKWLLKLSRLTRFLHLKNFGSLKKNTFSWIRRRRSLCGRRRGLLEAALRLAVNFFFRSVRPEGCPALVYRGIRHSAAVNAARMWPP